MAKYGKEILGPNHTQYKISLMFSYKMTFERELRPHSPSYVTFSYKLLGNCMAKQDAYKCREPQPSSTAKNDETTTCLSTPLEYQNYQDVRYVYTFMKVVLTTSMTPYENMVYTECGLALRASALTAKMANWNLQVRISSILKLNFKKIDVWWNWFFKSIPVLKWSGTVLLRLFNMFIGTDQ